MEVHKIEDLVGKYIESTSGTKAEVVHLYNGQGNIFRIEPKSQLNKMVEMFVGTSVLVRILTEEEWKDDEL